MSGALLAASCPVFAGTAPKVSDPCFKRSFDKAASAGHWSARECAGEGTQYFQVVFRDGTQQYSASFSADDSESIANISYQLVAPDVLAVDLAGERGGRVYLLHRVSAGKELFVLKTQYEASDEGNLAVTKVNNTIHLDTGSSTISVTVNPDGSLTKVHQARPKAGRGKG
jgi:hypothetical protein